MCITKPIEYTQLVSGVYAIGFVLFLLYFYLYRQIFVYLFLVERNTGVMTVLIDLYLSYKVVVYCALLHLKMYFLMQENEKTASCLTVQICTGDVEYQLEAPVTDNKDTFNVSVEERNFHLQANVEHIRNGCTFTLPDSQIPVTVKEVQNLCDDLHNYARMLSTFRGKSGSITPGFEPRSSECGEMKRMTGPTHYLVSRSSDL